ncbi:MAG: RES domain-containing protein [Acidobacteria bacterium]|nr:RES domain-containing protein [Acidobacteriota bacterium]
MIVTAWRIAKRKHAKAAFTGEGARLFGGRWNNLGTAIIYTAQSQSLAALEMLVHLDSSELLGSYVVFEVGIDESLIAQVELTELPGNWRDDPPPAEVRAIGDAWVAGGSSAVLRVPSVVIPGENNYLVNPRPEDFQKLKIRNPYHSGSIGAWHRSAGTL